MIFYWYLRTLFTSQTRQFQRSNAMESTAWPSPLISNCQPRLVLWLMYQPKSILKHLKSKGEWIHIVHSMDQCTRQACSSHNSTWLWDECGDSLRAAAGKVTASKYIFGVTNFPENSCQPSCIMCKSKCDFRFHLNFTQTLSKTLLKFTCNFKLLVSLKLEVCVVRFSYCICHFHSFAFICLEISSDLPGESWSFQWRYFLCFFPIVVVPKTNRNFNRRLFLLKNWNNPAPPHFR